MKIDLSLSDLEDLIDALGFFKSTGNINASRENLLNRLLAIKENINTDPGLKFRYNKK